MSPKKNTVSQSVKQAIINAADKGEELSKEVWSITQAAVKDALRKQEPTIKKIEEVAADAARGFNSAALETKIKIIDLFNHAVKGISAGAESYGEKAVEAAANAAEKTIGIIRGAGEKVGDKVKEKAKDVSRKIKDIAAGPDDKTLVEFHLQEAKGKDVYLAGNFNGWSKNKTKLKFKDGSYHVSLELPPGDHEYKFLVDGIWTIDPGCPNTVHNELGSVNNVIKVN